MTHPGEPEFGRRPGRSFCDEVKSLRQGEPHQPAAGLQGLIRIKVMNLAIFAMRLLQVMFFLGLAGAAVVVLLSFVQDAKELFGEE